MYKCSAKCCETLDTMEDVQRCVENCSQSLNRAQGIIGQELQTYQVISICCSLLIMLSYIAFFSWLFCYIMHCYNCTTADSIMLWLCFCPYVCHALPSEYYSAWQLHHFSFSLSKIVIQVGFKIFDCKSSSWLPVCLANCALYAHGYCGVHACTTNRKS